MLKFLSKILGGNKSEKDVAAISSDTKDLIHDLRHSRVFRFLFGKVKK